MTKRNQVYWGFMETGQVCGGGKLLESNCNLTLSVCLEGSTKK